MKSQKNRPMIIGIVLLALILMVVALSLPPFSIWSRLKGDKTADAPNGETIDSSSTDSGQTESQNMASMEGVTSGTISREEFLAGNAAAANAIPGDIKGSLTTFAFDGAAPASEASVEIPADAGSADTLDLYGWYGDSWTFMPSRAEGNKLVSAETTLPSAIALIQPTMPAGHTIAADIRPGNGLPEAVRTMITELSIGTLTLNGDGTLLGEPTAVPAGSYRTFLRVTNGGAIVDTNSLTALLNDTAMQQSHIEALVNRVFAGGYAGLNLDYQGVAPDQQAAFAKFITDLQFSLAGQSLELAMTLPAPTRGADGLWDAAGYDWAAIGQVANRVTMVMPLDPTSYATDGDAALALNWATRQVDRRKLVASFNAGSIDGVGDTFRELPADEALANFGEITILQGAEQIDAGNSLQVGLSGTAGELVWDSEARTYSYGYDQSGQQHTVWLNNEAALSTRLQMANNVAGVMVRGLTGDAGDGYAAALGSYLGSAEAPQPAAAAIVWSVKDESGATVASENGSELFTFEWEGSDAPGTYTVQADFAVGENMATLGSVDVVVGGSAETTDTADSTDTAADGDAATTADDAETDGDADAPAASTGDGNATVSIGSNFRTGPGLSYPILEGLDPGVTGTLNGRNGNSKWLQMVVDGTGVEGWIFGDLIKVEDGFDLSSLPVVDVAPPPVAAAPAPPADGNPAPAPAGPPPPVAAATITGGFELGGQSHSFANPTLMSASGMNWVKFQHKWGSSDNPADLAGRIQQAHANGFKVLLSIPGSNTYPSSIDFANYATFVGGVATHGPDAIEIWNEMNIDFEWPAGQIDPASYVNNLLAPAYNAIKAANPNVMVISGAPAPTGFDNGTNAWADDRYMAGMAAAGAANYMDCIGVHHNAGAVSPNQNSGHPANSSHYSWYFWPTLNMYYNTFGGSRPVCFTELGYLSTHDFGGTPANFSWAAGTTVGQHAQWLGEAVSLSAGSGKVRLVIIFNVDFTYFDANGDPQAGYAMIRPGGNCPACDVLGGVMGGG